jgi:predicted ATPase
VRALRLSFDRRTGAGFFLRAESLFNVASHIDQSDEEQLGYPGTPIASFYGNKSLHDRSHEEAFFTLFDHKCQRNGLFLLDEPEAALSAPRQLALLALLHETLGQFHDAQFIISTHSPLLLGLPGAQIVSFDEESIHEIAYQDTKPFQIYRRFMNNPKAFVEQILQDDESDPPKTANI